MTDEPRDITPDALLLGARLDETDESVIANIDKLVRKRGVPWCEERVDLAIADTRPDARLKKDGQPRTLGGRFFKLCSLDSLSRRKAKKRAKRAAKALAEATAKAAEASP